ncbi:MAG: hypothetical protein ACFFA8_11955 [Promethearchaeota archaeon]
MSNVISKGKFPKRPQEISYFEICRKDFNNLKKEGFNPLYNNLDSVVKQLKSKGENFRIFEEQKQNLEEISKLVKERKERVAFSLFYRTFPYCMPHRNG